RIADRDVLVVATGLEGDPMDILEELAYGKNKDLTVKQGDTVIFSAEPPPGASRQLAAFLDQFLSAGVRTIYGARSGVYVSKHASREELKLMLSIVRPRYFVPALGEGRHIMHHAQLAAEWGMPAENVFPLKNGEILEIGAGGAGVIGEIESQSVLYNRDQGERVTTFSVNERRTLSLEGALTVGCVIDPSGNLVSGPTIEAGASGFLQSDEWQETRQELAALIREAVAVYRGSSEDAGGLRAAIKDLVTKTLRARLQAKPMVHVVVHEVTTSRPE
ncbi:MAG TPA: ribonuclease J, partial [Candidatus Obscuribacterales bacterium]